MGIRGRVPAKRLSIQGYSDTVGTDYRRGRLLLQLFVGRQQDFFLSLGTSLLADYESSNWSEKQLFDGSILQSRDSFIYGGAITLELECYLTDKVLLLLNTRERVLWGYSDRTIPRAIRHRN